MKFIGRFLVAALGIDVTHGCHVVRDEDGES